VFFLNKAFENNNVAKLVLLFMSLVICIYLQWTLAIALIALFLRPTKLTTSLNFEPQLQKLINIVFLVSVFLIGTFLNNSFDILWGVVLGLLAVISQILVSLVITLKLPKKDKVNIALAQYNGITSIVLAIFFEQYFKDTIPTIIIAIVTINIIYYINHYFLRSRILESTD
jgi:hypothetical protein